MCNEYETGWTMEMENMYRADLHDGLKEEELQHSFELDEAFDILTSEEIAEWWGGGALVNY